MKNHPYQTMKKLVISSLIFYFLIGVFSGGYPKYEFYPLFSWFLFSKVPDPIQEEYTIAIKSFEGNEIESPVFFENAADFFSEEKGTPSFYQQTIQELGRKIELNEQDSISNFRKILEGGFKSYPVSYDVIFLKYHVIDYWTEQKVIETRKIASFQALYE